MGSMQEHVVRLVLDRMVILHSREHAPFLLFVETLCPAGLQESAGTAFCRCMVRCFRLSWH